MNAQANRAVEVKQSVEEAKEQALGAADTYFDFLGKTISSFPSGGTEFGEKLKGYTERNIAATHEFTKQLSQANDFQGVLRIQTEFIQTQTQVIEEQTKSLAEAFIKTATSEVGRCFNIPYEQVWHVKGGGPYRRTTLNTFNPGVIYCHKSATSIRTLVESKTWRFR